MKINRCLVYSRVCMCNVLLLYQVARFTIKFFREATSAIILVYCNLYKRVATTPTKVAL